MSAEAETVTKDSPPSNPDEVTFEINGQTVTAAKGSMVIQAADAAGIYIPRFCYHKKLSVAANCRMCLVEVEKAPKPLPACATPVAAGMKVFTQSPVAKMAQKGVMEFLLINHPLDCPICDQGGECQLQDLAMGYGGDISRFAENKRIVKDKNLGPLISTDMTRCIHCTRCVRFGEEIAGIREMGATGRGEHTRIGTYIEKSIDSELSGNVIDLCPVGALTSKPYRYTARPWELTSYESVSPHDCVGANLTVQTRSGKVMRVLPRENEGVNETWLADRDRFSYEALNSDKRLLTPMIQVDGKWQETDWDGALEAAVRGLGLVLEKYGARQLGALAAPGCTFEEHYLLQKLMRSLGSGNVDHRLRQTDFSDDNLLPPYPWLGQSLQELEQLDNALLIGSNINKDQPLIGLRLRKAHKNGASIMAINPVNYTFDYKLTHRITASPQNMLVSLGGVVKTLASLRGQNLAAGVSTMLSGIEPGEKEKAIASLLAAKQNSAVLLGNYAQYHAQSAQVRVLAQLIAELSGAKLGYLPEANSVGAWLAGCVPHRGVEGKDTSVAGLDSYAMFKQQLKGMLLMGLEPDLDSLSGGRTRVALQAADFVVMLASFKPEPGSVAHDCADVLLPMAAFTETAGTLVNCEGNV
ncbi:MAG: NADH-quinone oxidoreductase subunit NuoG, partial [Gammaproteobacteria bacterium]|nr:NADH-quinone oxidoreductase subunit NuoG [Gammaproteobacteria bacterium]